MPSGLFDSSSATDSARALRAWRAAGALFCALMLAVHVVAGLNTSGVADFWRDMYWATVIAHGERFPLAGPPINNLLELGPWWFYLLALPIWLTERIAVASAFLQALAALKYVLAWRLGTRLIDARFGFAFAASLAVAGWSAAAMWFPSHPALTETALLLLAFALWRCWDRFNLGAALLFGLAAAACVHAHPTTAPYIAVGGAALLHRHRGWRSAGLLAIAAAVVALSLLPPWFDAGTAVPTQQITLATYANRDIGVDLLKRIPALLYALPLGGAWSGLLSMTKWSDSTVAIAWWAYCACLAMAVVGVALLRSERRVLRRWFAAALALLVCQVLFLAIVRPFTPIWMAPSCLPPLAFAVAIGWYGWFCAESRVRRAAGVGACALYVALALAPLNLFLRRLHSVRALEVNTYMNIADVGHRYTTVPAYVTTVRELDRIAAATCAPATLHLRLGALMEGTSASALRNACGRWPEVNFSGAENPGAHVAGIPAQVAASIGIAPERTAGGMGFYSRVHAIAPAHGARIAGLRRMEVARRPPREAAATANVYEFDTNAADIVGLANRYPMYSGLAVRSVDANGRAASRRYTDGRLFLYACAGCVAGERVRWRVELDAVAENIDVAVIEADGRTAASPAP